MALTANMSNKDSNISYNRYKEDTSECPKRQDSVKDTLKNVYTDMRTHDHRNCEKLLPKDKSHK